MDGAGASIERKRAPYVLGARRFARTDPGIVNRRSRIGTRAAKPQAESARECRLGPAGVGGRVPARVAPHDTQRLRKRRSGDEESSDRNPQDGEPRWNKIDNIVKFRGGKTEGRVPRRPVADHAVGGVDGLVANAARKAAKRQPEDGSDDSIGKILGKALDGGAGDVSLIEARDIAADDVRCRHAARVQSCGERLGDGQDMCVEASLCDEAGSGKRDEGKAGWGREVCASARLKSVAALQASAKSKASARTPIARRYAKERSAWFKRRSPSAIRHPIQVTG